LLLPPGLEVRSSALTQRVDVAPIVPNADARSEGHIALTQVLVCRNLEH